MWWKLVLLGILCMIFEIFTPGFILLWFGISFIIAAIPIYFGAPLFIVIIVFISSLFLLSIFIRKIALNIFSSSNKSLNTNADALIHAKGFVVEEINSKLNTGKVRINKEIWTAISSDETVIECGEAVQVVKLEGVKLFVEREQKND